MPAGHRGPRGVRLGGGAFSVIDGRSWKAKEVIGGASAIFDCATRIEGQAMATEFQQLHKDLMRAGGGTGEVSGAFAGT